MAAKDHLIPEAHKLTHEDHVAGGHASVRVRREKKRLKELLELYLADPVSINGEQLDRKHLMALNLVRLATEGGEQVKPTDLMKAFELIRDTIGEKPSERVEVETQDQGRFAELLDQLKDHEA